MHKKIITRFALVQWIELVVVLTVFGGLAAFNIYSDHAQVEANEHDRLITQANVISKNLAFQFQGANQALLTIMQEIPEWQRAPESATKRLSNMANSMPGIRGFGVFDAKGTLIYTNFPQYIGMNFSYREYYKTARQSPDPDMLYVSPPFKGLRGNVVLNLTRMIPGKHGEFAGIVTATLDPEYFKPLLASVLYTADTRSSLVHSKGALFISEPETGMQQGMNLAVPGSFFTQHMQSGKAMTVFSGQLYSTKEHRMIAQTTLSPDSLKLNSTLLVAVSRDLRLIFKHWHDAALIQAIGFMTFSLFSLVLLCVYQRRERLYAKIAADSAHALFQSEKLFRSTYDSAAIGMTLLDLTGRFMQANRALCHIVGYDETTLCQMTIQHITHPDDLHSDQSLMQAMLTGQRDNYQVEKRFFHQQGHTLWTLLTYSSLKDETGNILQFLVQVQDITEYKSLQEKLQAQANHDFLTGLPNRRHFMDKASTEVARSNRYGGSLSLLMIDIDYFKRINDNYGHQAGDIVLQRFSQQCKAQLRDIDLLCRHGGEEFAVLLPETGLEQALEVAERLRACAASSEIKLGNGPSIHLTISIGVAVASREASLQQLLVQTDAALYSAKQSGRNKVCLAPSS